MEGQKGQVEKWPEEEEGTSSSETGRQERLGETCRSQPSWPIGLTAVSWEWEEEQGEQWPQEIADWLRAMGEGTEYGKARISSKWIRRHVFKWQQEQRQCSDVVGVSKERKEERERDSWDEGRYHLKWSVLVHALQQGWGTFFSWQGPEIYNIILGP